MRLSDIGRRTGAIAQLAVHRLRHGNEPVFRRDYVSPHAAHWMTVLAAFRGRTTEVLEIGSYEGRSALFFLDALPDARVTCVDTFPPARGVRFDHNTWRHRSRLIKIRGRSACVLDRLVSSSSRYDVIYVDGGHQRIDVLVDSVLAWQLLKVGGVLMWDDYLWETERASSARPQHAIDLFRRAFASCFRELHSGYQVIVEKTAEWPQSPP